MHPIRSIKEKREARALEKANKKAEKKNALAFKEKRLAELTDQQAKTETKVKEAETKIEELQTKLIELSGETSKEGIVQKLQEINAIDSSLVGLKNFRMDKMRRFTLEVEIWDGPNRSYASAKIDKFYLKFRAFGKKQEILIVTKPNPFERTIIPLLYVKRGLSYVWKRGEPYTHNPDTIQFDLPTIKMTQELTKQASRAKMFGDLATSSHGKFENVIMMAFIFSGIIVILAMLIAAKVIK